MNSQAQVCDKPSDCVPCTEADILGDTENDHVLDEDIITYFFRLLTPEHSDHLFSQLSNLGAPPLERLLRCGISVRRPAEGETIAEAGNAHRCCFGYEILKEQQMFKKKPLTLPSS